MTTTTPSPRDQDQLSPYSRFRRERLVLRDELAIDRTLLANERTLLAYLRSGVALLIAGASIMHFAELGWFRVVGIVCLPAGVIVAIVGIARYRVMNAAIRQVRGRIQSDSQQLEASDSQSPD